MNYSSICTPILYTVYIMTQYDMTQYDMTKYVGTCWYHYTVHTANTIRFNYDHVHKMYNMFEFAHMDRRTDGFLTTHDHSRLLLVQAGSGWHAGPHH